MTAHTARAAGGDRGARHRRGIPADRSWTGSSIRSSPPSRRAAAPGWGCRSATASCSRWAATSRCRASSAKASTSRWCCRQRRARPAAAPPGGGRGGASGGPGAGAGDRRRAAGPAGDRALARNRSTTWSRSRRRPRRWPGWKGANVSISILCDLMMPEMTGMEMAARLQREPARGGGAHGVPLGRGVHPRGGRVPALGGNPLRGKAVSARRAVPAGDTSCSTR